MKRGKNMCIPQIPGATPPLLRTVICMTKTRKRKAMTMTVGIAAAAIAMTTLGGVGAASAATSWSAGGSIYVEYSVAEVRDMKSGIEGGNTVCNLIPLSPPYNFMCGVPAAMTEAVNSAYYQGCKLTVKNTPTGSGNSWDKAVISYFPCGLKTSA